MFRLSYACVFHDALNGKEDAVGKHVCFDVCVWLNNHVSVYAYATIEISSGMAHLCEIYSIAFLCSCIHTYSHACMHTYGALVLWNVMKNQLCLPGDLIHETDCVTWSNHIIYTHTDTYAYTFTFSYPYTCTYIHMHMRISQVDDIYIYTYIHIHVYIYTHTYTYTWKSLRWTSLSYAAWSTIFCL